MMMTPAFENLLRNYDKPQITLIGPPVSLEVLEKHPQVVKTLLINKKYLNLYKTAKNLEEFDAFFSFRGSFRSMIMKFLVSSKKKYQYKSRLFKNQHQVEKYNNFVNKSLDVNFNPGRLYFNKDLKVTTNKSNLVVGINPGASYGSSKRWYSSEFAKVAAALSNKYDIVIFGGTNEKKFAKNIENLLIEKGVFNYQNLAGSTNISDLIKHIANLDLFITGDSGPMHVASSYEIPTVSIFGPTRHNETSQWKNKKSVIVKKKLECQPCMKRTCPLKHHNCMRLIKSEDVLSAVKSVT
jgi:heptosyltransferase-2